MQITGLLQTRKKHYYWTERAAEQHHKCKYNSGDVRYGLPCIEGRWNNLHLYWDEYNWPINNFPHNISDKMQTIHMKYVQDIVAEKMWNLRYWATIIPSHKGTRCHQTHHPSSVTLSINPSQGGVGTVHQQQNKEQRPHNNGKYEHADRFLEFITITLPAVWILAFLFSL